MPRGIKGSGKKAKAEPAKRSYPTVAERLEAVDKDIERLTKLNEKREALITSTENTLNARKSALEKSSKALANCKAKKEKLERQASKPAAEKKKKLTPEERSAARLQALEHARAVRAEKKAARLAEDEKYKQLVEKMKETGKTVDDLIEIIEDKKTGE